MSAVRLCCYCFFAPVFAFKGVGGWFYFSVFWCRNCSAIVVGAECLCTLFKYFLYLVDSNNISLIQNKKKVVKLSNLLSLLNLQGA